MDLGLNDKNVLITGASRGIGRALAIAFSNEGARVAFTFRSSTDEAAALKRTLEQHGTDVLMFQGDVADFNAAKEAVDETVTTWGSLDVLVNNAGITRDGLMIRMTQDDWQAVVDANLTGVFNFCKHAYRPMMKQRSGKIVNLSSVVGITGNPGQTNYAASKAGIIGFSKSLARELGGRGITVNVVAPGYVRTDMTASLSEKAADAMLAGVPLGRAATPEEIAAAVLFLSSRAADYITGTVLQVDGGLAM